MAVSDLGRTFAELLDASHGMTLERLPGTVCACAAHAGFHDPVIYLADLQEDKLRLVTGEGPDAGADGEDIELWIDGTPAGRAFTTLEPQAGDERDGRRWAPLLCGAERVGVLGVRAEDSQDQTAPALRQLAALVAMMIISMRPHSDSQSRLVRAQSMTVGAELQWNLMPPRAFTNGYVTISAAVEPAYGVGGDAFDYGGSGEILHLGIFDSMGHDVGAGLTANLAVAACRNARRQSATLVETGETVERTLIEQLGTERYVTAVLADLNTRTGELTWISHGHHSPVVIRGNTWTGLSPCPPAHPLGTDLGIRATLCRTQLDPGDRLVLYTDGITEARNAGGEEFGLDRFMDFVLHHNAEGLPVPETLRRLIHSILDYQQGRLHDDATVLFLEWHGPHASYRCTDTSEELRSHPGTPSR